MSQPFEKLSTSESLRIVVKSKQVNNSDISFLRSILGDKFLGTSNNVLKVYVGKELANLNHMGVYSIRTSKNEDCLLVPLHDESFLLIESVRELDADMKICSDFYLIKGNQKLFLI